MKEKGYTVFWRFKGKELLAMIYTFLIGCWFIYYNITDEFKK